jgi:predicted Zn finger-like uncharacterized protein
MKIVCDACGTRYSIEDSRVAGRSFKIRCKHCAHVIVVAGARAPTAEPAAAGAWHAVIDGMPRPIATEDLRQLRAASVLDDRTLVWREGLDDWRELGSVVELRGAAPVSVELAPDAGTEGTAVDLPKAGGDGGARADAGTRAGAAPEDRPEPAPLRGVRHENSVLFSLGNLARLAAPAPATASSGGGRSEGSGLLDIQALARSLAPVRDERSAGELGALPVYGALPFSEPVVLIPSAPPRRDRRLIWALAATVGGLVMVAAVLLVIVMRGGTAAHADPPPAPSAGPGTSPTPPAAPGAPGAPATPGTVAHSETGAGLAGDSAPAIAPSADPAEHAVTSADRTVHTAVAPSADRTERTATVTSADQAVHTASTSSAARTERTSGAPSGSRGERAAASHGQTDHAAGSPAGSTAAHDAPTVAAAHGAPADAAARPTSARTASLSPPPGTAEACSEITCIVNGYTDPCCAAVRRPAAGGAPAASGAELPDHPDRAAIAGGLGRVDTSGCGKQSSAHGDVSVSVKVSPAGAVTGVTVRSSPDPALAACVTAAVSKGAFPATQRGGSFGYAWRF